MVRAGMVKHPSEWTWSGYHEIQQPKARYRLIDHETLRELLHVDSNTDLAYPVSNRRIADVVGAEGRDLYVVDSAMRGMFGYFVRLEQADIETTGFLQFIGLFENFYIAVPGKQEHVSHPVVQGFIPGFILERAQYLFGQHGHFDISFAGELRTDAAGGLGS